MSLPEAQPMSFIATILRRCAAEALDLSDRLLGYEPRLLPAQDAMADFDVLVRWGDGESSLAIGKSTSFQQASPALAKELRQLLRLQHPRIMLCLPGPLVKSSPFRDSDDRFRRIWLLSAVLMRLWARRGPYGDSLMFRRDSGAAGLDALSNLALRAHRIVLVSSEPRHLKSLRRMWPHADARHVLVPASNAYARRDEIKQSILRVEKPDLLLLSAGPTGKCLARELITGWQDAVKIVDTGHLFDHLQARGESK
jgi:hypothetical protein